MSMLIAVELVVAAVLFGAVKFLAVRRCGLTWLLAVGAMVGCSEPHEVLWVDELYPSNLEELVALSAAELERVDVGRMNLICADAVSVFGGSELPRLLRRLDEWADDARKAETAKHGVERQSGFDPKCDQVLMKGVTSAGDFTAAWAAAARETDGSDPKLKVREAHLFTHSGPGKIYMRGSTVSAASIKQLPRLNWDVDGKVICHGCNSGIWDASGDSVAGNFAQGQSVLALGQTGFSQFSEREDRRTIFTRVGSDSQTVYLWSYGDGGQSLTFGDARPPRQFLPSGK